MSGDEHANYATKSFEDLKIKTKGVNSVKSTTTAWLRYDVLTVDMDEFLMRFYDEGGDRGSSLHDGLRIISKARGDLGLGRNSWPGP